MLIWGLCYNSASQFMPACNAPGRYPSLCAIYCSFEASTRFENSVDISFWSTVMGVFCSNITSWTKFTFTFIFLCIVRIVRNSFCCWVVDVFKLVGHVIQKWITSPDENLNFSCLKHFSPFLSPYQPVSEIRINIYFFQNKDCPKPSSMVSKNPNEFHNYFGVHRWKCW